MQWRKERKMLRLLWDVKIRDPTYFHEGRDGDHIHVLFEYNLCLFWKIWRVDLDPNMSQDKLLL